MERFYEPTNLAGAVPTRTVRPLSRNGFPCRVGQDQPQQRVGTSRACAGRMAAARNDVGAPEEPGFSLHRRVEADPTQTALTT